MATSINSLHNVVASDAESPFVRGLFGGICRGIAKFVGKKAHEENVVLRRQIVEKDRQIQATQHREAKRQDAMDEYLARREAGTYADYDDPTPSTVVLESIITTLMVRNRELTGELMETYDEIPPRAFGQKRRYESSYDGPDDQGWYRPRQEASRQRVSQR